VTPPTVDKNGYGLRVPGLVISPYARKGYIDHQILSFDAYLKFIEDAFLSGRRLDPKTDGRPDPRPTVRENASVLGDLAADFDFNQQPRPPMLLPLHPATTLTPTVPFSPYSPRATAGNGQATLGWRKPTNDGSAKIKGYVVTPYINHVAQTPIRFDSTATTATVTGLKNGTTYQFSIAARNSVGIGYASVLTTPKTMGILTAPAPPTATPGNNSARVSWHAPPVGNAPGVFRYIVTPYLGTVAQGARIFKSAATTQMITGLKNSKTYTFRVAAVNINGTSPFSLDSNKVAVGSPLAPTGAVAKRGSSRAVAVSWRAPASTNGAHVTAYVVTLYVDGKVRGARNFNARATHQTITRLEPGTIYTFKVSATNARGTSPRSHASNPIAPK